MRCCECGAAKKKENCSCPCDCFGYFNTKSDGWDYDLDTELPTLEKGDIKILYRDKIKVFYPQVQKAEDDGYNEFKADLYKRKKGYLYSFTGL